MGKSKWNLTLVLLMVIVLVLSGCGVNSLSKKAIKIIEDDYVGNIEITAIYHNEEQGGCIVRFTNGLEEDVACVHLDTGNVGYESEYDELLSKQNTSEELIEYVEHYYNPLWVFNLKMNGTANSDWERIK